MRKVIIFAFFLCAISCTPQKQPAVEISEINKTSFIYAVNEQDTLRLDKYDNTSIEGIKPCVMFVFGGGFVNGTRDNVNYLPYFKHLANQGYVVVSIDYRLGLKKAFEAGKIAPETGLFDYFFLFYESINMAVEDLLDATNYVIRHSEEWAIDTKTIVATGSSAGALAVLHATYELCNDGLLSEKLPAGFNYAGVISFAGGLFYRGEKPVWKYEPAPIMFFHGDADSNVPYDKLRIVDEPAQIDLTVIGGKGLFDTFKENGYPSYLHTEKNAAHEIAENAMTNNLEEISLFLRRFVIEKKSLNMETEVIDTKKPDVNKNFTVFDYLRNNGLAVKEPAQ